MKLEKNSNSMLFSSTEIPDVFFTEYMSQANGDFIKVYLYLLFLSKYDKDVNLNDLSISLIDKNNDNILYEGDTDSLMQIYSNYRDSNYTINVAEIFEDINNLDENEIVISDTENNTNINEDIFNNEIDSNLDTKSDLNISNNEKNNVLDEYIDKFEKYDKELLVNNNDDIIEWEIVLIVFGVALAVFIMFKIISRVKRLQ